MRGGAVRPESKTAGPPEAAYTRGIRSQGDDLNSFNDSSYQSGHSLETLAQLRSALNSVMSLDSHLSRDDGAYEFRGRLVVDSAEAFDHIYGRFTALGFTPMLFRRDGQEVVLAQRGVARPRALNPWVNIILFGLTIISTILAGMMMNPSTALQAYFRRGGDVFSAALQNPAFLLDGLPHALALLAILGVHEMGHYVLGRIHKADVTLPYFIPMPPLGILTFGTIGAVILMRSPIKNRRQLFDIGVAGPLAGLAVAIPLILVGLATSPVKPIPTDPYIQEGNSILYLALKLLVHGRILPGDGLDVSLSAVAFAAWFGLFITSLNLLPIGSLDGGHVTYSVFGRLQWQIARGVWLIMIAAGIALALLTNQGLLNLWLFWALLVQVFGMRHPAPLDDITPLDPKRRALGIFTMLLFVLLIVPIPLTIVI